MMFYNDVDKSQHPIGFYESLRGSYGDLKDEATYKKFANNLFTNTMILDENKWGAFCNNPDATVLQADPAYATATAFVKNWVGKYLPQSQQFNAKNAELGRLYLKGILKMDTVKG